MNDRDFDTRLIEKRAKIDKMFGAFIKEKEGKRGTDGSRRGSAEGNDTEGNDTARPAGGADINATN